MWSCNATKFTIPAIMGSLVPGWASPMQMLANDNMHVPHNTVPSDHTVTTRVPTIRPDEAVIATIRKHNLSEETMMLTPLSV
jgi:hypothetical protein